MKKENISSDYKSARCVRSKTGAHVVIAALVIVLTLVMCLFAGCAQTPKNITRVVGTTLETDSYTDKMGLQGGTAYLPPREGPERREYKRGESGQDVNSISREAWEDSVGEELWVIYRPERHEPATRESDYPGTGALMTRIADREMPLPLKHTEVRARVTAYIASVNVTQQFENPYDEKIEAVYVFPLPENGAVNEFLMTIGQRRIRGIIRERKEAERIYRQAREQGYTASLLTQERPNIFTQSVANIEPGKQIDVTIRYFNTLTYSDGWYEFVFPMVVGPRFNPPGFYEGVGSVSSNPGARSLQSTDVHYLRPDERSGHDVALELDLHPGVKIEDYECKSHAVLIRNSTQTDWIRPEKGVTAGESLTVRLGERDAIPNKDFVFRYRVAGQTLKSTLITHEDERGGFFTMAVYPPARLETLDRVPLELVFVLDCSGSMSGQPLAQAKSAIHWALHHLEQGDTFQLINFSDTARQLGRAGLPATPANLRRAERYLDSLQSEGGTMMIEGIKAALSFPHDPERLRFVCFLTDGYIGNENEILQEVHHRLGDGRIFSFGIGSSVNRFLLESMARLGHGAVAYLGPKDDGGAVMGDFFERISHPAMIDLKIDWGDFQVSDVYPKRLPDLFSGRALIVTGRYDVNSGVPRGPIELRGRTVGSEVRRFQVPVIARRAAEELKGEALPSVWARMKIAELLEKSRYEPSALVAREVRRTALDYSLMSPYTAFLAMDASRRTHGEDGTTLPIGVPVPAGVKYHTTVEE